MTLQIISIVVLAVAFALATVRPLNLGAITFGATFVIGALAAGLSTDEIFGGFPAKLLVVLVGVTYLFNVANANGTIDWLIAKAVRMVRGRTVWVPWIMFATAAVLSGIGAVYAVAFMAPIALGFAVRNRIPQFLMGLMVIHGWGAGALSPISIYGVIVNGVMVSNDLPSQPFTVFLIGIVANVVAAITVFVALGGLKLVSHTVVEAPDRELVSVGASGGSAGGDEPPNQGATAPGNGPKLSWEGVLTLVAIVGLVVGVAFLGLAVGLLAVTLAVLLGLFNAQHHRTAVAEIPWSVVLLVAGVLTYVAVLEQIGTIDFVGGAVTAIGIPIVAALVLAYVGAVVSAFATSSGIITALIPLAVPLIDATPLGAVAVVGTLAVASTIVDVNPFSTNGSIVVANTTADQRDRVLRNLLVYGALVVLIAPLVAWLAVVVPGGVG